MTCLQIIWIGLISSLSCSLATSVPVFFHPSDDISQFLCVYWLSPNHLRIFFLKSVSFWGLFNNLLAFLSVEPDWKPSWRLMHSGDPLCAHSPLRISPPCKSSKVKPWARPLLRDCAGEGVGAELNIMQLALIQATSYMDSPGTKSTR